MLFGPVASISIAAILWSVLFGSIGLGYFMYGRKQKATVPLVCGLLLMVYPYVIANTIALVVIGVVLSAVPYFVRR
ncbi:hypothetical protein [Caenimonas koreensis]|uniref:hypothetical protein n=1 Tax=Caenimonas koreensis TaxID=367474 RepID=UPI001E3C8F61|nr:hypothetical protein [Caenimonas koreensis]